MEDFTQSQLDISTELLIKLAKEHQLPAEIAEQMIHLMYEFPDLSVWGSRSELISKLETVLESAFSNNPMGME